MSPELSLKRFRAPRYWLTWLLLGAMHAAAKLPPRWQRAAGTRLGRLLRHLKRREYRIARRNLALCFPELRETEVDRLLDAHFEAVGMSFVEMGVGWFSPLARLLPRVEIAGQEHLEAALSRGKGALLVSAHFTALELCVAVLEALTPNVTCMYRPQRNAMMDVMIRRGRSRFAKEQIPRDNVRALIRSLRANNAVVYLPDQTYLGRQSELLPFFGVPAVTNTATSKLAAITGAAVLPYFFRRLPSGDYRVDIGPALDAFPSNDPTADTLRIVALLERYIRLSPEQYLWIYKKFKGRPAPHIDPYAP